MSKPNSITAEVLNLAKMQLSRLPQRYVEQVMTVLSENQFTENGDDHVVTELRKVVAEYAKTGASNDH